MKKVEEKKESPMPKEELHEKSIPVSWKIGALNRVLLSESYVCSRKEAEY